VENEDGREISLEECIILAGILLLVAMGARHVLIDLFGAAVCRRFVQILIGGAAIIGLLYFFGVILAVPYRYYLHLRIKYRERLADLAVTEADADLARVEVEEARIDKEWAVMHTESAVILNKNSGKVAQCYRPHPLPASLGSGLKQLEEPKVELEPEQKKSLTALDVGLMMQRAFIWGGTRSGKTHFCKTLAYHYLQRGNTVVVFDPEYLDPKDPWPNGVVVFGTDDDWEGMMNGWQWIFSMKEERSQHVYNGGDINDFEEVYIFFDEINESIREWPDLIGPYQKVLRRFSKYKIYIICLGQTDDVESVGLKNKGKIKLSFSAIIKFFKDPTTEEFFSWVDFQDGRGYIELMPYKPVSALQRKNNVGSVGNVGNVGGSVGRAKNAYFTGTDTPDNADNTDTSDNVRSFPGLPTPESIQYQTLLHRDICEIFRRGESPTAIVKIVKNKLKGYKPNRREVEEVRQVLRQYGYDPNNRARFRQYSIK
jgi:hypothetical protein